MLNLYLRFVICAKQKKSHAFFNLHTVISVILLTIKVCDLEIRQYYLSAYVGIMQFSFFIEHKFSHGLLNIYVPCILMR